MPSRDLKVTLVGDDRTSTAFGSAGNNVDSLSTRFANLGRTVGIALAGVAAAGVAGFGALLVQGARDAASYEQITSQVAQTIRSTGGAAGVSAEGLKEYAGQLESMSGVDEELILSGQNVLLTFTNVQNRVGEGNDIFNQASEAALNLSTTMGGDLVGANTLVGKALNDPIAGMTALRRAGVQLTDAQQEQVKAMVESGDVLGAQKVLLNELTVQFGGAAEAAGSGLTGSIARAKDAFQDMFRNIATALLPKLADLATFFTTTLMPGIQGVYDLVIGGDFTGALSEAFGWSEDSGVVNFLFNLRDAAIDLWPHIQTAGATLLNVAQVVLPALWAALSTAYTWVQNGVTFFRDHRGAAIALGTAVGLVATVVAAAWVAQAVVSTANAARSVVAWVTTATASTTSATIQSRSTAQIAFGWAVAAAQGAIGAARVVASWVLTGAQAVASAAVTAAAWVGAQIRTVASLAVMAAGFVAQGAAMVAAAAVAAAGVVGSWVVMGAQSLIQAARMAAAWVIAMGPVGWVIAAVVGLVALIVANWDTVVAWTQAAWSAVTGALQAAWNWIVSAAQWGANLVMSYIGWWASIPGMVAGWFRSAYNAATGALGDLVNWLSGLPGQVLSAIGNFGTLLYNAGRDLLRGLWNGISSMASWLWDRISGWASDLLGNVGDFFGIASPSRRFAEIGRYLMQGMAVGIDDSAGQAVDAAADAASRISAASQVSSGVSTTAASSLGLPAATGGGGALLGGGAGGAGGDAGLLARLIEAIASRPTIGQVITQDNETAGELAQRLVFAARTA